MKRLMWATVVILAMVSLASAADPVPASRKTDWTYAGVPGGIPYRTTICASYTSANPPTVATVNAAIGSCSTSGGGVIYFGPGTYSYSGIALDDSNVTIRGAGARVTIFLSGASSAIDLGKSTSNPDLDAALTGGGVLGTKTITVATTDGLAVGTIIELARDNESYARITATGDTRLHHQLNRISAIDGTTLTLQNPLLHDYTAGSPTIKQAYAAFTALSGIEDLTIDHSASSDTYGLWMQFSYACWLRGVESYNAYGYHVQINQSLNLEIRDSYFHKIQTAGQASNGILQVYGNLTYGVDSSGKIENNIFDKHFPGVCFSNSASGFYVGYNYFYATELNPSGDPALNYVTWGMDDNHSPHQVYNLWEGNVGEMWGSDSYYGGSSHGLVFRNHLTGYHPRSTKTQQGSGGYIDNPIRLQEGSYYYTLVGNVLGSPALNPDKYVETQSACGGACTAIYRLGYPNMGNTSLTDVGPYLIGIDTFPDPMVASTLMRWGNYDYYNDATRWESSEIPTGVDVPANQILPNSYYYSAMPSWWPAGVAWPPIGPDVTGGTGAGNGSPDTTGHTNKIPAQLCFERLNLGNDGSFTASSCYAPSAPTNVRIR